MSEGISQPLEIIVDDQLQECPYLEQEVARMPLRLPINRLTPAQLDKSLAAGDRRSGIFVYRATCPSCQACEALRLDVQAFQMSKSQKRVARRGRQLLQIDVGRPLADQQRVDLYNEHRRVRGLARNDDEIDLESYVEFLVNSCCDTVETTYRFDGQLVGVAISDRGQAAMSAVYYYFDPRFARLSPGVFNVITQIELCRQWEIQYLYLGYYIARSEHMSYKSQYLPHERRVNGQWQLFHREIG